MADDNFTNSNDPFYNPVIYPDGQPGGAPAPTGNDVNNAVNAVPNDPNTIINQGANASGSSAPPYVPLTSTDIGDQYNPYGGATYGEAATNAEYQQMVNPQLTPNTTYTYNPIDTSGTNLQYQPQLGAAGFNPTLATLPNNPGTATYTPTTTQEEMEKVLHSGDDNGDGIPDWADPAVTSAQQRMNSLGLGASTLAGTAQVSAILQAAIPMAMANGTWENASRQINAQSENQMRQFFTNLAAQISSQNADRTNDVAKFLTNLNSAREQFNLQNQLLVDQSNIQWRRTVNTADNAGFNAVNMANIKNMFNMSQTSLNNLWQQARDEASWSLTASENSRNRFLSLVNSALNRQTSLQILSSTLNANMFSQLGSFATNLLGGSFGSNMFNGIFGNSNNQTVDGIPVNELFPDSLDFA